MKFKTLDNLNVKNKTVLLRADLNSEISKGKVILSDRITETAKTIQELKDKDAKIVILAHQSRPGKKDFTNLEQHAKLLSKYTKVKFVPGIINQKAIQEIQNLKPKEAVLLDNIRNLKEEFSPSTKTKLVQTLAPLANIYINDAFSASHRKQTSIVSFPKVLPSAIGRTMQKELESLEKLSKMKNAIFILGGSKMDNLLLMKKRKVLTCGVYGHMCLIAKNYKLGAQEKYLKKEIKNYEEEIKTLKKLVLGARTPMDLAVKANSKRKELSIEEFPSKHEVFDIGAKTIKLYKKQIKHADAIFMKGTAGCTEDKKFQKGTKELLKAIAKSKAHSVLSGGHTSTALKKFKINKKKFDYVSLSGGALVFYLTGKRLPGLDALIKKRS